MLTIRDLGLLPYRDAWRVQEEVHAGVVEGVLPPTVLLVEHPAVITLGRRAELSASHVRASTEELAARGEGGVEVVESDRGGDVTFHGPGQLVAYPILRLADFKLSVGGYVRRLQEAVIGVCEGLGVAAGIDPGAIGVWAPLPGGGVGKVCAVGVRVKGGRGGATMHGLALNVTTDLSYFGLIVPCGIGDRAVTSLREVMGEGCPSMAEVKGRLVRELEAALGREGPRDDVRVVGGA